MEGEMPLAMENLGAGGSHVGERLGIGGSEVQVRNELNERQLMEKLEKSEAGRKKLRHAIVLLKEKLDATANEVEANEVLREEVEKERLNVDIERKRAEAERWLREKVEKESSAVKERLVGVLHRLDILERSYKAEFGLIRSEVKEAVRGIGARLHAVEATKGLYQSLERSLHAKINGAVQSSSEALAIAQSVHATTFKVHSTALAAQSLAKAVQEEVQLVSSQFIALQKQALNLSTLDASLQPELQLRGPGTPLSSPDSGEASFVLAVSKEKVSLNAASPSRLAVPPHVTIIAKNQIEVHQSSKSRDVSSVEDVLNMVVASPEKSRSNPAGSSITLPPRGGSFLSRNQILNGGLKPPTTTSQTRPGVRSPSKGSLEVVSRDESIPNSPLSQPVSSSTKKGPVAIITGVSSILSPAVRVRALLHSGRKLLPRLRDNAMQKQSEAEPQRISDNSNGWDSREFSKKRWVVKRGQRDLNEHITCTSGLPEQYESSNTHIEASDTISEGMSQPNGKPDGNPDGYQLLKSIMKIFEKERKNRRSIEEKLLQLEGALETHCGPVQMAQAATKRKSEPWKGKGDGGKKRHRPGKESKKISDFRLDDAVTSPSQQPCTTEDKCTLQEEEDQQNHTQSSGDVLPAQDRLSNLILNFQGRCRGEGLFETTADCREITRIRGTDECEDSSDVDICNDETVTNTDLESTDDELGEGWWAEKVLLSPISSNDPTS